MPATSPPLPKPGRPRDPTLPARRREEILEAAQRVFADRGFHKTDVGEIAVDLGLGKGTLYRYFPSKEALFLGAVDRGMRLLREAVERAEEGATDPLQRVSRAARAYLAYFDRNPALVELLLQERSHFKARKKPTYFAHRDANLGPWRKTFRNLIREGRVRDVPVDRITDVISDLLYGTIFTNYFAGRRKSFEAQAQDVLDVLFHGILSPGAGPPA